MQGRIIKGIAGFYDVYGEDGILYECKARGIFRKDRSKPLVGDIVIIERISMQPPIGNIVRLCERKNELIRPAVSNVDQALVIFAMKMPEPNFSLLDRFLIMMKRQKIPCVICMNKADLSTRQEREQVEAQYAGAGCTLLFSSTVTGEGMKELRGQLSGKTSTVAGPSGVGKSSVVNAILDRPAMETGELSQKISRGKNTTRHSFFHAVDNGTFLLDTPGFSSLELPDMEKEELRFCYPEFSEYEGVCRFQDCVHVSEPDCAVKQAVAQNIISKTRYERYVQLFDELKSRKRYL